MVRRKKMTGYPILTDTKTDHYGCPLAAWFVGMFYKIQPERFNSHAN